MSERATTWRSTLLVFLPILLLAALGIKGLQSSKHATREAAERETAQAVRRVADSMELAIANIREAPLPIVYPLPPVPGPPSPARQLYEEAQRGGFPDSSRESFDEALLADPDAVSESGIPLAALAAWDTLRGDGEQDLVTRVDSFARTIVESHPSILTPEWLQRAAALLEERAHDTQSLSAWQERWERGANSSRLAAERCAS